MANGISFNRLGRWWGAKDVEIDILAYDSNGEDIVFGECKYSKNKKGMEVLMSLKEKAKSVKWKTQSRNEHYCIYSKSGFTDELIDFASKNSNVILKQLSL